MWIEMYWDDEIEAHIAAHNVYPEEVQQVLHSDQTFSIAAPGPRSQGKGGSAGSSRWHEPRELHFGRTEAGRYLTVVTTESRDGRMQCVTARDMDQKEKQAYKKRNRR